MASRIDFGNIVGDSTVDNGGNAGKLLALVMAHLAVAKSNNQLTASEVGAIYAASISNAINVALEFELKRDLSILEYTASEVGIDKLNADIALISTQREEAIANGLETRKVQEKDIEKINVEMEYTNVQKDEALLNGLKAREVKDVEISYTNVQKDEALLNGEDMRLTSAITREVKEADKTVKNNQADLLVRQKTSLDDTLLKDLFKESVGGYGMIYEALQNQDITVPTLFTGKDGTLTLDSLASELKNRVES